MGYTLFGRCTKCGQYASIDLGCGMFHDCVMAGLKDEAKNGKFGKALKRVVEENPNGEFDGNYAVYKCTCGGWRCEKKLDYYISKQPGHDLDMSYNFESEAKAICIWKRKPRCPRCKKAMYAIPEKEVAYSGLICMRCGAPIDIDPHPDLLWD